MSEHVVDQHPGHPQPPPGQHQHPHAGGPHPGHPHPPQQPYGFAPEPPRKESLPYRMLMAAFTRPAWLAPLAVLGCMAAAMTYVLANDPSDTTRDPLGPCLFKTATGLDCPGCGGTRMVWFLLHGDVLQAARYHVIALIAVPVVLWAYVAWAGKRLFDVKMPKIRIGPLTLALYLTAWMVFAVVRNLPWMPFHYLYVS